MIIARWPPAVGSSDIAPHKAANHSTITCTHTKFRGFSESQLHALFRESTPTHSPEMLDEQLTLKHRRCLKKHMTGQHRPTLGRTQHRRTQTSGRYQKRELSRCSRQSLESTCDKTHAHVIHSAHSASGACVNGGGRHGCALFGGKVNGVIRICMRRAKAVYEMLSCSALPRHRHARSLAHVLWA